MVPMFGAYHYGSHYSNSGIVIHYLVRIQPFTTMAIEYQGRGQLDKPVQIVFVQIIISTLPIVCSIRWMSRGDSRHPSQLPTSKSSYPNSSFCRKCSRTPKALI
jgi:hypothetical protein